MKTYYFNMLFGSNFGDWDNVNNLLRAPLAAAQNGLTNAWSSRPHWQHHAMAMGFTIGDCARTTQNNINTYAYNYAANAVHVALMGDPTLRLHIIAPPTNVLATATNSSTVDIHWNASIEPSVLGYYLYRSDTPLGHFTLLNSTPQNQLTYTDNSPLPGTNYYQIKAVALTTSPSGSYYNTSIGATASASGSTSVEAENNSDNPELLHVSPIPSHDYLRLQFPRTAIGKDIELLSMEGKIVSTIRRTSNASDTTEVIDIRSLSSGMYIVRIGNLSYRFMKE
ncbi:MAG: T9SS type A sorting domain-containing protein [Ignavibacteria bacterium]|nr:T9SS type A sorting domain-containing protein [Ignavibacteria bacterium]